MGLVRKGECQLCGNCCTSVVLVLGYDPDATPEEKERAEDFLSWAAAHQGVKIGARTEESVEIKFETPCSFLLADKDGKYRCGNYKGRFIMCRKFPEIPTPNCPGFWFENEDEQVHPRDGG